MNCHHPDYYTGVLQSYLAAEEHTQRPEQFTRDWTNSKVWKRAIPRWKMFPGAEWGDGKIKSQTSMYTNVERVPLLRLHAVLRACFCKVPFMRTLSKTALQFIKSCALAICWCTVINHGRGRGKNYIQEMTLLSTVCAVGTTAAGPQQGWPSSPAPLLHGLLRLSPVRITTFWTVATKTGFSVFLKLPSPPHVRCLSNL